MQILTSFFTGRAKVIYNLAAAIALFACTMAFDYFLIPIYGITGASWANVIASALTCILLLMAYRKMTRSDFTNMIYLTKADLKEMKSKTTEVVNFLWRKII